MRPGDINRNTGSVQRAIEPLDPAHHSRDDFVSGVPSLDDYLGNRANQDLKRKIASVFVLAEGFRVIGYYTLSAYTINPIELPREIARKLPRYGKIPATLLGRLAVDRRYQGEGLGEILLLDALQRSLNNTPTVGSFAVVVEAESEKATGFYVKYGFVQLVDAPHKLFLPMRTIAALIRG